MRGFILRNESVDFKSECELSALLSATKLDDLELLLHGLDLGYLADIMTVSTGFMLERDPELGVFAHVYIFIGTLPFFFFLFLRLRCLISVMSRAMVLLHTVQYGIINLWVRYSDPRCVEHSCITDRMTPPGLGNLS